MGEGEWARGSVVGVWGGPALRAVSQGAEETVGSLSTCGKPGEMDWTVGMVR